MTCTISPCSPTSIPLKYSVGIAQITKHVVTIGVVNVLQVHTEIVDILRGIVYIYHTETYAGDLLACLLTVVINHTTVCLSHLAKHLLNKKIIKYKNLFTP